MIYTIRYSMFKQYGGNTVAVIDYINTHFNLRGVVVGLSIKPDYENLKG